jgi:hypothetical protein
MSVFCLCLSVDLLHGHTFLCIGTFFSCVRLLFFFFFFLCFGHCCLRTRADYVGIFGREGLDDAIQGLLRGTQGLQEVFF